MTAGRKTIVITGGAGQLGRAVGRQLRQHWDVVATDLHPDGASAVERCDVTDIAAVRASLDGADAVCHLAGLDFGRARAEEEYIAVNVTGAWNVLQAAAEGGCRKVILASSICSSGLLDAPDRSSPRYLPIDEDHPRRPFAAYSAGKAAIEDLGRTWARRAGMEVVALQPAHVVSAETLDEYLEFVAHAGRGWLHSYVVADDVANAVDRALATTIDGYEQFLITADQSPFSVPTLDWYRHLVGPPPPLQPTDPYRSDPRASVFSSARATALLGWHPRRRLADLDPEKAARITALAGL